MSSRFIDKYEIVSTLGRGSMGVVYKGRDPEIGRLVAIKTLKSVFMGDDPAGTEALERFRLESRSAGKLHHPNIVTIFEAGRTESGSPYIVMEYIEGKSLEMIIAETGPLEALAVLHYLAQIAGAIDYAHSQNVIHRDIKPSNILADAHHRTHLLDFGVAKLSDTSLTPAGTVVGTPSYMSPEQIRGAKLDGRTDLFSLAVVAYEAFTGVRPFPGSDFTTVVSNIIHKEPLSFAEVGTDLPEELEKVLQQGLSKERDDRLSNALAFVDSMANVFGIVVDGTGVAGGYTATMRWQDLSSEELTAGGVAVSAGISGPAVDGDFGLQGDAAGATIDGLEDVGLDEHPINGVDHGAHVDTDESPAPLDQTLASPMKAPAALAELDAQSKGSPLKTVIAGVLAIGLLAVGGYFAFRSDGVSTLPEEALEGSPEGIEVVQLPADGGAVVAPKPAPVRVPVAPPGGFDKVSVSLLSDAELKAFLGSNTASKKDLQVALAEAGSRKTTELLPELLALLNSPEYRVRVAAIKSLDAGGFVTRDDVVLALIAGLGDKEPLVRGFSAKTLAGSGSMNARAALERQLAVESNKVVVKVLRQTLERLN